MAKPRSGLVLGQGRKDPSRSLPYGHFNLIDAGGPTVQLEFTGYQATSASADTTRIATVTRTFTVTPNLTATKVTSANTFGATSLSGGALSSYATPAIVQQATNRSSGATSSGSVSLTSTATAGNLLFVVMAVDKVSGVITPPAGFTMIQDHITGIGVSGGIAYRVAAGGEQSITFSYATASQPGYSMAAFEVSGTDTTSPLDVSLKDITFAGATSRTLTLGPTGTLAIPSSFAFAVFENDSTTSFNAPSLAFAFTNGFTIAATNQSANLGLPGLIVGTKQVSGTDPVSTTASYEGDAADEAIGFLAVFKAKPL